LRLSGAAGFEPSGMREGGNEMKNFSIFFYSRFLKTISAIFLNQLVLLLSPLSIRRATTIFIGERWVRLVRHRLPSLPNIIISVEYHHSSELLGKPGNPVDGTSVPHGGGNIPHGAKDDTARCNKYFKPYVSGFWTARFWLVSGFLVLLIHPFQITISKYVPLILLIIGDA